MANSLKLVIFDCDGTLVDSQHMILTAMTRAYAAHGIPVPEREKLLSIVGLSLIEAFTALGNGVAEFPVAGLAEQYRLAFHALRASGGQIEPLYPGAADTIGALARREDVVLGIATGKSQRGVRLVLGHHGLLDHFITIKTADDAPSKPDPGMVVDAMREAGVNAADTVVVGRVRRRDGACCWRGRRRRDVGLSSRCGARRGGRVRGHRPLPDSGADARQILDIVTRGQRHVSPQFR